MGVLSDFYIADEKNALAYDVDQRCHPDDRAQYKSISPLELSKLWAIIEQKDWDLKMMDEFPDRLIVGGGERLIFEFKQSVTQRMAALSEEEVMASAAAWAQTEEIGCAPADIRPLLRI